MAMKRIVVLAVSLMALSCLSAGASTIYWTSGSTGSSSEGFAVGKAEFAWGGSSLQITIENLTDGSNSPGGLDKLVEVIDGFGWDMSGGPALSLVSATGFGEVRCYKAAGGNPAYCAPAPLTTATSLPADKAWGIRSSAIGGIRTYTLQPDGGTKLFPYGIVNGGIKPEDGLKTDTGHQPFIYGPVTFTFSTGLLPTAPMPEIGDVTFLWGTTPDRTTGTCTTETGAPCGDIPAPEPASMLLLGSGLLGAGFFARRRRK